MSTKGHVADGYRTDTTTTESPATDQRSLTELVAMHDAFQHRATSGGVHFADVSTATSDTDGNYYVEDIGQHVRLYLDEGIAHATITGTQLEEEDTGMEGERDTTRHTRSLVAGHALYEESLAHNTSQNVKLYELANGEPLLLSFAYIPVAERRRILD
jgi:hypothetical protein